MCVFYLFLCLSHGYKIESSFDEYYIFQGDCYIFYGGDYIFWLWDSFLLRDQEVKICPSVKN